MVHIEEDMIVNRINHHYINHHHIDHHHIIHHEDIIYNILNLMNLSMKRNCKISSINTIILKITIKMKGWSIEGEGGSLILTLIEGADSRTLIGETGFLILFLPLMGVLILSQSYFGSIKLMEYLT